MALTPEEQKELEALEAKVASPTRVTPKQMQSQMPVTKGRQVQALPRSLAYGPQFQRAPATGGLSDIETGAQEMGGRVTDLAASSALTRPIAPTLGTIARMVPDIATSIGGFGGGGALARPVGEAIAGPASRSLMHSALKPVPSTPVAQAERAVTTMLEEGENVTLKGIRNLQKKISELESKVKQTLKGSKETINLADVGQSMAGTEAQMLRRSDWEQATKAVRDVYSGLKTNPLFKGSMDVPVSTANEVKQGLYKQAGETAFDTPNAGPTKEGLKSAARGIKDLVGEKVPEIQPMLKRESDLINVMKIGERRVATELRNNHGGIMWLAENPKAAAGFMMDKSSAFKSWLANFMNRQFPGWTERVGQATGAGTTMSLQEIGRDNAGSQSRPF